MKDNYNRNIQYMRLSLTDKCNFRCKYCMPKKSPKYLNNSQLLTSIEIVKICSTMSKLGITKVKLTGGEPFLRQDIGTIIKNIKSIDTINKVTITTNGLLVHNYIDEIKKYLDGINISIDTLDAKEYYEITNQDVLNKILQNIDLLISHNVKNIKLNCVPLIQSNKENIINLANYANQKNITLRFIEMMPIGLGKNYKSYNYKQLISILEDQFGKSKKVTSILGNGPAIYYEFENLDVPIGFILAISNKFCETCNRIRVTSDGKLKQCLHFNNNIDLKELIKKENVSLKQIEEFIFDKPKEHKFHEKTKKNLEDKNMSFIGG